ncbi:hypothetical protein DPMN_145046 [Dreissena polymorpha]|uniref:Uncharacterized protein n=1 Tax=Dreissena polymorpha TaxID=45954 RepID=A0A9D4F483_DREPO|nr:hypothetical protein DPMN_145046 [Dreissena polymorpha]
MEQLQELIRCLCKSPSGDIALENDKISFVKLGNPSPHMNAPTKAPIKLLYALFDEPLTSRTIHSNTSITVLNIELIFI